MTDNKESTQITESGLEIPIPTKEEVMAALLKVARPVRKHHTLTYEETINDGRTYVVARCGCGWVWQDNGIVGYNEKDVQIGAKVRYRDHVHLLGVA